MAQTMRWQPSYSVGVRGFDDAHRVLVDKAGTLIDAVASSDEDARTRDIVDDLIECAVEHFDEEERTLRDLGWPGLGAHMHAHNVLLRTILKFKADLRYHRLSPEQAAEFISSWVLEHIRHEDMQYAPYLQDRGVH